MMKIKAAVVRVPRAPISLEEIEIEMPREKEILGKVFATEICHTEVVVLGRDGTGTVQQVGRAGCGVCWKHNRCSLKRRT